MTRTWIVYVLAFLLLGAGIAAAIRFDLLLSGSPPLSGDNSTVEPTIHHSLLTTHSSKIELALPHGIQVKFVDVTERSGIHFQHFDGHTEMEYIMETLGSGIGWLDYHNVSDGRGGRRFVDITAAAGLATHPDWKDRPNFSTSAAFLDFDNDGYLDLFVCSYVKIDVDHYPKCVSTRSGRRFSCPPNLFKSTHCLLYRNNRNGTFTDVSHEAGIDDPNAKALGVVALDLDDDGRIDLFVANDGMPNFLFRNLGNGRFESIGPRSGCAVNLVGARQAYMGVDADDLNGDGRPDLFVTAFSQETNTLFRNEGGSSFLDVTPGSGLGPPSWLMLGFGACFLDVDRDGSPDIVVANGHVARHVDDEGDPSITFKQAPQLFLNDGRGHFRDLSGLAGAPFQRTYVGRGLAAADYDNDGHMDLLLANSGGPAVLLHNESTTPNGW